MWAGEVISNLRGNFTHHCRVERVYVWQKIASHQTKL
jgi:hypothetical protein